MSISRFFFHYQNLCSRTLMAELQTLQFIDRSNRMKATTIILSALWCPHSFFFKSFFLASTAFFSQHSLLLINNHIHRGKCVTQREERASEKTMVKKRLTGSRQSFSKCTVQVTVWQFMNAAASKIKERLICCFPTAGEVKLVNPKVLVVTLPALRVQSVEAQYQYSCSRGNNCSFFSLSPAECRFLYESLLHYRYPCYSCGPFLSPFPFYSQFPPCLSLFMSVCVGVVLLFLHGSWLCSSCTPICNQLISLPGLNTCLSSAHQPKVFPPRLLILSLPDCCFTTAIGKANSSFSLCFMFTNSSLRSPLIWSSSWLCVHLPATSRLP